MCLFLRQSHHRDSVVTAVASPPLVLFLQSPINASPSGNTCFIEKTYHLHCHLTETTTDLQVASECSATVSPPTFLPPGGHEIPVILLLKDNGRIFIHGSFSNSTVSERKILLRLGTRVSDTYPSTVGFRIVLRNREPNARTLETMEDAYYVMSFRFRPQGNNIMHSLVTMSK